MKIHWKDSEKPKMEIVRQKEVTFLRFPSFSEQKMVNHGFSTRLGGASKGIYASMNLSFTRGDEEDAVRENFRRVGKAMGFDWKHIVMSDQTHTTRVREVSARERGEGLLYPKTCTDVDGLITRDPHVVLATFYADCVPLFFLDPVKRAIGLSHSGWKGTVGRIGENTVQAMAEAFGSHPEDILAAIGPSICQDCYEVSEDVIEKFQEQFARELWDCLFYRKENGKYQLNLWEANRQILLEAGIVPEHISLPNLCTCCNPDFLFSHRASEGKRGNLGAFLELLPL